MELSYDPNYPSIEMLRQKAKRRIPRFAFEYLDGGCNSNVNVQRNTADIRAVQLRPDYIKEYHGVSLKKELFGKVYDAPFGVAPIGLQGLMWPRATEILAQSAFKHNIPFILSTVATADLEQVSKITEGNAWFQLYHPAREELRNDLLNRLKSAGYPVLVILSDVPVFPYRPHDIKNGLAIPPKMTVRNILQMMGKPSWAFRTLLAGQPQFATMKPYLPKDLSLQGIGHFMKRTFDGRLNEERIKALRDLWPGKLVLKGVASEADAERSFALGLDGIIVSNHGGRQLDPGESSIKPMTLIAEKYKGKMEVMMDSGIRSGPDIACSLASGADFTFLGRSFMYGVAALGETGGDHTISMLKIQLQQVMEQIGCECIKDLPGHLVRSYQ